MRPSKFHGRYEQANRQCEMPGCHERGEFRAPGWRPSGFDGPGEWRWFCLDHVREFNAGYDWFDGMSAQEIHAAQSPAAGWRTESPSFRPTAGVDGMPRWADFDDPLDAISARANGIRSKVRREAAMAMDGRFSHAEAEALEVMGGWGSKPICDSCASAIRSSCGAITPIATVAIANTRRGWAAWSKPISCSGNRA